MILIRNIYPLKITIICLSLLWFSSALPFTVSKKEGIASGHEEITRQAIVHAAEILKDEFNISLEMATEIELTQLTVKFTGLKISGGTTDNPVIMGNFATDKTDFNNGKNWPDGIDIRKYYNFPPKSGSIPKEYVEDLLYYGGARDLHFTRNKYYLKQNADEGEKEYYISERHDPLFEDESMGGSILYQSARSVCEEAKKKIIDVTEKGLQKILNRAQYADAHPIGTRNRDESHLSELTRAALFFFGMGSHTIQDSFSGAHTLRSIKSDENYRIKDVCYYKEDKELLYDQIKQMEELTFDIDAEEASYPSYDTLNENFQKNKTCVHRAVDLRDFIWIRTEKQKEVTLSQNWPEWSKVYWNSTEIDKKTPGGEVKKCSDIGSMNDLNRHQCLKHEARLARVATMKYFILIQRFLNEAYKDETMVTKLFEDKIISDPISIRLNKELFEGNAGIKMFGLKDIMPDGIIQCENLDQEMVDAADI